MLSVNFWCKNDGKHTTTSEEKDTSLKAEGCLSDSGDDHASKNDMGKCGYYCHCAEKTCCQRIQGATGLQDGVICHESEKFDPKKHDSPFPDHTVAITLGIIVVFPIAGLVTS